MYTKIITSAHTIISGSTGSGKSVLINNFLYYLIRDIEDWKYELWIIDPKRVDYMDYRPFCKEYAKTIPYGEKLLDLAVKRMFARYDRMEREGWKEWPGSHIYILADEFGQILRSSAAVASLDELLRLGRAARVHVIAANQNAARTNGCPSHLRVNFTCQIGLHCVDKIASRQAIGCTGCESLPLFGYCYVFTPQDLKPELWKITMIDESEIKRMLKERARK